MPDNICMKIFKCFNSFKCFSRSCLITAGLIVGGLAGPNTIVDGSVKVIRDGLIRLKVTIDVLILDTDISCTGVVMVVAIVTTSCIVWGKDVSNETEDSVTVGG